MAYLGQVVHLSEEQYAELKLNGTITVVIEGESITINYNDNDMYITPNEEHKTIILFSIGDELEDNTEYRLGEQATLNIIEKLPTVDNDKDFICSLVFTSGETATKFNYDSTIKWSGEDLTDNKFVPVTNKRYTVVLWYDGVWNGTARGVI